MYFATVVFLSIIMNKYENFYISASSKLDFTEITSTFDI